MRRNPISLLAALLFVLSVTSYAQTAPSAKADLPASTQIDAALLRPLWAGRAKPGDPIYAITQEAVEVSPQLSIPAGTYVEGTIDGLTRPTSRVATAALDVQFNRLIFANGYTVVLTNTANAAQPPVRSLLQIKVSAASDILLDEGASISLTCPRRSPSTPRALRRLRLNRPIPASF